MKKVFSLILALAILLSVSVAALAASKFKNMSEQDRDNIQKITDTCVLYDLALLKEYDTILLAPGYYVVPKSSGYGFLSPGTHEISIACMIDSGSDYAHYAILNLNGDIEISGTIAKDDTSTTAVTLNERKILALDAYFYLTRVSE